MEVVSYLFSGISSAGDDGYAADFEDCGDWLAGEFDSESLVFTLHDVGRVNVSS